MKENALKALESWILRVTDKNTKATPEELMALPGVASVLLRQLSLDSNTAVNLGQGETVNLP